MNFDQQALLDKTIDPNSSLSVTAQALRIGLYDEYKAFETYTKVIQTYGNLPPFSNIVLAEQNHIDVSLEICRAYNVTPPINDWAGKVTIAPTFEECCQLGVDAELDNIAMYDYLIDFAENDEIRDLFFRLQAASYNNHLPAFSSCVQKANGDVNQTFQPKHHDIYRLFEKAVGGDLGSLVPKDLQGVLGLGNKDLLIGAALGAGAIYLLDEMKTKNNEEE